MPDQPAAPAMPPKPFKVSKWLIGAGILFAAAYLLISLIHIGAPSPKEKAQPQVTAAPATQQDLDSFARMREQRMRDLAKRRDIIRDELQKSGLKDEAALVAIVNQLPGCDQAMREKLNGQNYAAVNQQTAQVVQFACESDDQWHPLPAQVADIQPPTAQQERAMMSAPRNAGSGRSDGMSKKEKAAEALKAALASTSVVDFASTETPASGPSPAAAPPPPVQPAAADEKKNKYGWDSYTGPLYHVFEGDVIEGILTNRLAGEFTGPVSVMVTTNLYSRDRQHILMPQGTRILGEAQKVGVNGQRRLAVPFHRAIMPDGYSVDVDQFAGLDQQGASGLTGRVNTHWPKLIATAVMVGAIGGLSEVGASGTSLGGLTAIRLGVTQESGQEATQILNRALNVLPTITVYEGTRVRIWVQKDMQLPAYENHTVSPTL